VEGYDDVDLQVVSLLNDCRIESVCMTHRSRICFSAFLLVVLLGSVIVIFNSPAMPTIFLSANPEQWRFCFCTGGSHGKFVFTLPEGRGGEVCPAACASNGGVGTGQTLVNRLPPNSEPPNRLLGRGNTLCFLKEGAAGNCQGNNWCTCGTAFVQALGPDGKIITRTNETGQVVPAKAVAVLPNHPLTMQASIEGFGGSESQYRAAISPLKESVEIANASNPVTLTELPLPARDSGTRLSTFSYKFSSTLNELYYVSASAKGYYHWNGGGGSCSYACGTTTFCPGNTPLEVYVIDHPKSGKTYPSAYP
jgi:hypothetical protein